MCQLYFYCNNKAQDGEYFLIVVNVRDEYWDRPGTTAKFWSKDSSCLSGLDLKGGGTWFGLSKSGRFGSLLNVLNPNMDPHAHSRGPIVTNYLESTQGAEDYMCDVISSGTCYNFYNLVLIDTHSNEDCSLHVFSNWPESEYYNTPRALDTNLIHCFGNSYFNNTWKKLEFGQTKFSKIVNKYHSIENRDRLVYEVNSLLQNRQPHLPDPVLASQSGHLSQNVRESLSCLNVWSPTIRYGSRTRTIVLVDSNGCCEYIESNMITPSKELLTSDNAEWTTLTEHLNLWA